MAGTYLGIDGFMEEVNGVDGVPVGLSNDSWPLRNGAFEECDEKGLSKLLVV
jgi:hypothetical protein